MQRLGNAIVNRHLKGRIVTSASRTDWCSRNALVMPNANATWMGQDMMRKRKDLVLKR